jgi:5'-phosphate synthase pdxT subunit
MKIGVLALQGDFREHIKMLTALGAEAVAIKVPHQLEDLDGLIIPGGESTAIGKLMVDYGLVNPIRQAITAGMPIWGTCAGLILLAKSTDNALAGQPLLASMDIHVCRNAFGTQRESFAVDVPIPSLGEMPFHAVFIRAPIVISAGPEINILARLQDDTIIAVQQDRLLGTAFHPEISGDTRLHNYFLGIVQKYPILSAR